MFLKVHLNPQPLESSNPAITMDNQESFIDIGRPEIFSVSSLTSRIKDILEEQFDFIWIEAEISNFRKPSSGHYYMVLKDEYAQIRAVMFRPQARYINFRFRSFLRFR